MIAAIVILYHPDMPTLAKLIESITDQVDGIYIIDNTPGPTLTQNSFANLPKVVYRALGNNYGIAKAQNVGITLAIENHFTHVLLMDQDSCLAPGLVQKLVDGENSLAAAGKRVAAIGPLFIDQKTRQYSKAIRHRYLGAGRGRLSPDITGTVESDYIIASGSLIRTEVLKLVGFMDEDMFIDGVDIEWCFRAKGRGYLSYIMPGAIMSHSIGDTYVNLFGKNVILHSDIRNFYIVRNACYLLTKNDIDVWLKLSFILKIPCYIFIYSWFAKKRRQAFLNLLRACKHGFSARLGPAQIVTF